MFEEFSFAPEDSGVPPPAQAPWKILIADDEEEIHLVTKVALADVVFKERGLQFLHAHSAREARRILEAHPDIAVLLLDVVMEAEDAGLLLVRDIRENLNNRRLRIVLRTGQPGQAPEREVVIAHDINDYKSKTELTRQKLLTCIISALRSFDDILSLEKSLSGLEYIVSASGALLQAFSEKTFAEEILTQINLLLGRPADGLIGRRVMGRETLQIISASGKYLQADVDALATLAEAMDRRANLYRSDRICLYIQPQKGACEYAVLVPMERPLTGLETRLIEVLSTNISAGLSNVQLYESLVELSRDLENQVTERTRDLSFAKDAAEAANRAKSEFLAVMSHEIRTPMNGMLGMMELALGDATSPAQREHLETAQYSAETLLSILNDILDFSKMESGTIEFESIHFDLIKTVDSVISLMSSRAADAGLWLTFQRPPELPRFLNGDVGRLRQVLLNLISNALKFTTQGGVTVTVDIVAPASESILLRFTVLDTGIGIEDSARARLFQPFSQADNSISRRFGGSGLGLSICKKIVEMQGGRIDVDSTPDVGSRFWFELPFRPSLASEQTLQAYAVAPEAGLPCLDILLAEDNPVNQRVAKSLLQKAGHRVEVAHNGIEAIEALRARSYDAVLMDMHMPGMDGLDATRLIRQMDGPAAQVPIIALTAAGALTDIQLCMDAGMNFFLVKPFRMERLRSILLELAAARQ